MSLLLMSAISCSIKIKIHKTAIWYSLNSCLVFLINSMVAFFHQSFLEQDILNVAIHQNR